MIKQVILSIIIWGTLFFSSQAATVDTVNIYSTAMKKSSKCVVVVPGTANNTQRFPVVYLLHGYSGNYSNWINRVPELGTLADTWQLIIVCPDGEYSSWYFNSPLDSNYQYETYIATEVVHYIDKHFPTLPDKNNRAITGLSMGGHGGLFLGWRNPEIFSACGSMSGGVNLNAARSKYDISKRIGDTIRYKNNWNDYSVYYMIEKAPRQPLAIIFDCGTEDFFYDINAQLHKKMVQLKIQHDYIERPGAHNWEYWRNALPYQLQFFSRHFKK